HAALKGTFFGYSLGMDCAGVVERVGADVQEFVPGDLVICCAAQGTFRSFVTLNPASSPVIKWPDIGSQAEVAGLAVAFVTAERALLDMARLEPGETVLLHSAAGGVGHAAVQVARHRGARVIATAGSPEKRARALELGAELVFDSRSLDFLDQVRAATDGRGVDVALNFLSGDAQEATLAALAPYGRLVEIGKGDISANRGLSQAAFQENLSFISVDTDRLLAQRTQVFVNTLLRTRTAFEEGAYQPIPSLVLPATETEDAFRCIWESTHLGRIAVDLTERGCRGLLLAGERFDVRRMLNPQAAYLVTGGFGGFGLRTAAWLADHGARHLVLAGRHGVADDEARQALEALRARGIEVLEAVADVSCEQDVRRLLDTRDQDHPPLRGILHCAGVLADAGIDAQTPETFARVFDAKVRSALRLPRISLELDLELDLFVLFSSVSAVVGNTGQANYAAANAFLDGLAVQRRSAGLPALSVAWGAIAETGMLARDPDVARHLASLGVQALETDTALAGLEACLQSGAAEAGVFSLDWAHWGRLNGDLPEASPYAGLVGQGESDSSFGDAARPDFAGMDPEQGQQLLADILAEEVARVLRLTPEQVDMSASFNSLGMDSLMAFEFTLAAQERLRVKVRGDDLVKGPGPTRLAAILWPRIVAAGTGNAPEEVVDVASLSEEQVDAMLEQMQGDEQSRSEGV
ncbi:MAG: SDR family NAD(P)-dependent oxidoreductase, partial [Rhodobacteraceae bacterium]|nr:SDR family NAD(P)-dependent oxidoreductase [Paracoccaceae bacterium]